MELIDQQSTHTWIPRGTRISPQQDSMSQRPSSCAHRHWHSSWDTLQATAYSQVRDLRSDTQIWLPLTAISARALVPFASSSAISNTFNSLFKVLFIFPSWYLFAIGLEPVFSFRWNLPPNLRSNSEERDSVSKYRARRTSSETQDSHPGRRSIPRGLRSRRRWYNV